MELYGIMNILSFLTQVETESPSISCKFFFKRELTATA